MLQIHIYIRDSIEETLLLDKYILYDYLIMGVLDNNNISYIRYIYP